MRRQDAGKPRTPKKKKWCTTDLSFPIFGEREGFPRHPARRLGDPARPQRADLVNCFFSMTYAKSSWCFTDTFRLLPGALSLNFFHSDIDIPKMTQKPADRRD